MNNDINNKINDAILNFYLEADKNSINEVLKNDLTNFDDYNKKKKQLIFLAKAKAKQIENEKLQQLACKIQEAFIHNIEKPIALFKQMLQGYNMSPLLYNNLDKLSKDEIIEIIKDNNFVELLEQLDDNEQKI